MKPVKMKENNLINEKLIQSNIILKLPFPPKKSHY